MVTARARAGWEKGADAGGPGRSLELKAKAFIIHRYH